MNPDTEDGREVHSFTPVAALILSAVADWTPQQFAAHVRWMFPLLTALVRSESREIRCLVGTVLSEHVAPLLPGAGDDVVL